MKSWNYFLQLFSFGLIAFWAPSANAETRVQRQDLVEVFEQNGVAGTFVLFDVPNDRLTIVNPQRAEVRFPPASTFKIANSLIALETIVVKDELEIIPYGGKPQLFKSWEKDMSMRSAIKISNVPVYQELARRIGIKRYLHWLKLLDYGNQITGQNVENFWLNGPLKISAIEQTRFLEKLAMSKLPLSNRSQQIVARITKLEHFGNATLHGKTGWSAEPSPQIGWFVGWVKGAKGIFTFAMNIDINSKADAKKRKPLAMALLRKLGII